MIVLASGHAGVDRYWRDSKPPGVVCVNRWADALEYWADAQKIFVGERVDDFHDLLEWLKHRDGGLGGRQIVLWVGPDFQHPLLEQDIVGLSVWRGEIDREWLTGWWKEAKFERNMDLDRVWMLLSVYPYLPISSVAEMLTEWADQRFGPGGGWVDVDWQSAQLSMTWCPEIYHRRDFAFEKFRVQRIHSHWLVPAPPPWLPGTAAPENNDLDMLWRKPWTWQGWHLGPQIATPWAIRLLRITSAIVLWVDETTPLSAVERTDQFLRLYRDDIQVVIASPHGTPELQDRGSPAWRFLILEEVPGKAISSTRKGFFKVPLREILGPKKSPRKKE